LESRKDQLQKQIIEALNASDNDLYSLLKSQWAHRFGVESLDELKNIDLKELNQNSKNVDNQKVEQSQENLIKSDKAISIKEDTNKEEIKTKKIESVKDKNFETSQTKPNEIAERVTYENKTIKPIKENVNEPIIQTLIPLPPKPKYGYLKKWLLRK
tara:strand:- start:57 stop:527 length:471 start_codon:yes stop_codon:yes gene_type:complete